MHNAVRYIQTPPNFGCQTGLGIYASNSASGTQTVSIQANSVHDFQKNGITANGVNLTVSISSNTVTGIGPSPDIAQNGIQVGFGAIGTVSNNVVNGVVYSPCTDVSNCDAAATGILIYDSVGVTATGNVVGQTQTGIYDSSADAPPPGATNGMITSNRVSNTLVFDGIAIYGNGSTVGQNTITQSSESGVYIYGDNNQVNGNTMIEAPIGILIDSGTGTTVQNDKYFDVSQTVLTSPGGPAKTTGSRPHPQPVR